ncbi:hypothetical protein [Succinimonas sp.]|uniref:hypothetical protein n=1 Tax=Succinimonas sp. TaxID=1936151 RepID=UPI003863F62F
MYAPLEIIMLTDLETYVSRWLLVAHLFRAQEMYAPDASELRKVYPDAPVKDIRDFLPGTASLPLLITARHVHAYARKYHIPYRWVLTPQDIKRLIINALSRHQNQNAILTRDLFDDNYLKPSLKTMLKQHPECGPVFTADTSMARLRLYPSFSYLFTLIIPLLILLTQILSNRIHPRSNPSGDRTLVLWNMTDPFFIRDIIRSTSYKKIVLRIIDGKNRVMFPRLLALMMKRIPELEIESYEQGLPAPIKYFPQTFSSSMFRKMIADYRITQESEEGKVFFCGSCDKKRLIRISGIKKQLESSGISVSLYICLEEGAQPEELEAFVYEKRLSYPEYLKMAASASAILEIMRSNSTGMTLRPFEALFFRKKLITDNPLIREADIYHSDNIFLLGEDQDLPGFLRKNFNDSVLERPGVQRLLTENYLAAKFLDSH